MDQIDPPVSLSATPRRRAAAFSVHVFTAFGAGLALLALLEAVREHWAAMFAWLGVALIIDAADGPLARRLDVVRLQPDWSGEVLDLVVDFVTYVFVPAYAIAAGGLVGYSDLNVALVNSYARGAATGWIQVAATVGLFLALCIILIVRTGMGEDAFAAWGWRVPFLVSLGLLGISIWISLKLDESPAFKELRAAGKTSTAPLSEEFLRWRNLRVRTARTNRQTKRNEKCQS